MPNGKIVEIDGKKYYDVPGSTRRFPVEEVDGAQGKAFDEPRLSDADPQSRDAWGPNPSGILKAQGRGFVQGAKDSWMAKTIYNGAPEIMAMLSAALAPETGGASLAIPPLAAAGTRAIQNWASKGEMDLPDAATRGGLNAIPGAVGKVAGKFLPGSGTLTRAVEGAAGGEGWLGTIAKGLKSAMGGGASPAVQIAQAGGKANAPTTAIIQQLEAKLQDPSLNTTAKAAVLTALKRLQGQQSGNIAQSLRGVLGLGEGTVGSER